MHTHTKKDTVFGGPSRLSEFSRLCDKCPLFWKLLHSFVHSPFFFYLASFIVSSASTILCNFPALLPSDFIYSSLFPPLNNPPLSFYPSVFLHLEIRISLLECLNQLLVRRRALYVSSSGDMTGTAKMSCNWNVLLSLSLKGSFFLALKWKCCGAHTNHKLIIFQNICGI